MPPLRLSDEDAADVLRECGADVTLNLVEPALLQGQLYHPAIQVSHLLQDSAAANRFRLGVQSQGPDLETACERARGLRELMEALRFLTCCRGFAPDDKRWFWRNFFLEWETSPSHRLTPDLFRCFQVVCDTEVNPECLAAAFWTLLSPSTTPEDLEMTTEKWIEGKVDKFLERTPPPLQVTLCIRQPQVNWSTISEAMIHLNRMAVAEADGSAPKKVRLVIGTNEERKYWDASGRMVDILRMPTVDLAELHIRSDDNQIPRVFSVLWRELARADKVGVISWEFDCDAPGVAAIFSALPSMASLSSLTLKCSHDPRYKGYCGTKELPLFCRFWPWFAYALTQRKLRGLSLGLNIDATAGGNKQIKAACKQKNCLAQLVASALPTEDALDFQDYDVTAELAQGTIVAPLEANVGPPSISIYPAQRVNVIAKYGQKAVVVIPGAGLMVAQLAALSAWQGNLPAGESPSPTTGRFLAHTVTCSVYSPQETSILEMFGSSVTCLALDSSERLTPAMVMKILSVCPNVTKLVLRDTIITSFASLRAVFGKRKPQISTLIFQRTNRWYDDTERDEAARRFVRQCVDALAMPTHPIRESLRELCVEGINLDADLTRELVLAVRENKTMETLVMWLEDTEAGDDLSNEPLFDDLIDRPLPQNDFTLNAMYTFLSVARRKRVLRELPMPCLEQIAQFAATRVLRHFAYN